MVKLKKPCCSLYTVYSEPFTLYRLDYESCASAISGDETANLALTLIAKSFGMQQVTGLLAPGKKRGKQKTDLISSLAFQSKLQKAASGSLVVYHH